MACMPSSLVGVNAPVIFITKCIHHIVVVFLGSLLSVIQVLMAPFKLFVYFVVGVVAGVNICRK